VKLWRFVIPPEKGQGWGIFVLGEDGYFSCVSDFGDYVYLWTHPGKEFRRFLLGLHDGYLMGKLGKGDRVFDEEGTRKSLMAEVVAQRRDRAISSVEARELAEIIRDASLDTEGGVAVLLDALVNESPTFYEVASPWECVRMQHRGDLRAFVEQLWPRFKKRLREDIEREEREACPTS
jgi:hypothetical protein